MGKWSNYRGLEGKYFVMYSARVIKLERYMFQAFYADSDDERVWVDNLNNVFDNEKDAKALSSKLLAEQEAKRAAYEQEVKLLKEKEEEERKNRQKRDTYLDNLSYSESKYYLD